MDADPDKELLTSVSQKKDFVPSIVFNDSSDDWNLARELGEFLVRTGPELAIGHALVARASRHLGDLDRAYEALKRCRQLPMEPAEAADLLPLLAEEENHLSRGPGEPEPDKAW